MIGDAGHAKELETSSNITFEQYASVFGTKKYMPPEYHQGDWKKNKKAIDIW